jgi:hypothetical protein
MTLVEGSEQRVGLARVDGAATLTENRPRAVASSPLPDQVARIWDRLELRDRSMVVCLESIIRSVRIDGTASLAEVTDRYVSAQLRGDASGELVANPALNGATEEALRAELLGQVLPRLSESEVVTLPTGDLTSPDTKIQIANPWLRLALLESGLIRLDPQAEAAARDRSLVRGSTALTANTAAPDGEWAQLWFAMMRREWTTLAVIPASPRDGGLATAAAIVEAGKRYADGDVHLLDATDAAPHAVDLIIASMAGTFAPGSKLIIALDNPIANPSSIPIARAADASLLAVRLGDPSHREAQRSVDSVGRDFFIGSVAIRSPR